jgi:hypothetical protein
VNRRALFCCVWPEADLFHPHTTINCAASLQSLRNIFFSVDDALQAGNAHVSAYDLVELDGGFHGSHLVARVDGKTGSITFNQIALFDQATSKVYAISIYCTTECYDKYESKIDSVIKSWTVKDK